ncbi:hypothetical protein JZ751_023106 [Albula glossodonta]|uniref:Neutrophil cytosolic factor 1 n=1 Tax=Albula glossodonta TaxID=121402 RepID=A0A8T2PH44_9TELE|nr:hypothetical protein JZ751_023106 [Albula glossodonta]
MESAYIRHVELLGFEKRFYPSQQYVYMLLVKWSDLSEKLVYRKYPEIYTFHKSLKEMFPIEAGDIDAKDRIIPSLPAPKWFDNQKTTETRQGTLSGYCRDLIALPPKISRCQLLGDFFKVRPEDENPPAPHPAIAEYKKNSKYELSLMAGDMLEIVEKNDNGWWFCQMDSRRGWVPASYLEPLEGPDEAEELEPNYEGELYVTTTGHIAEEDDELTLEAGETIEVIHKLLDGWWVVRKGEETGHYPSMYLRKTGEKRDAGAVGNNINSKKPPPRRSTIRNVQSIHTKGKQKISQDVYRRNSRRYLQQRGLRPSKARPAQRGTTQSPLLERKNNSENITPKPAPRSIVPEPKKDFPKIPPRPSPELIMERCTEDTRRKISIRNAR